MTTEQKLNKSFLIVGIAIVFETVIFVLHLMFREWFWYIFLTYVITYILMLIVAKRVGLFNQTGFRQDLLYALLLSAPVILLPLCGKCLSTHNFKVYW